MRWTRLGLGLALGVTVAAGTVTSAASGAIVRENREFTLSRVGFDEDEDRKIDAVVRNYGQRVDVGDIIDEATQRTRPIGAFRSRLPDDVVAGFRWEPVNENEDDWRPQGITGSADAWPDGIVRGHRELVVSWHSEPDDRYSRITIVEADDLDNGRYRHVLLVVPLAGGSVIPLSSHAGGIVWYKTRLYVASTDQLLVFDMGDLIKVRPDRRDDVRTYNYILPLRGKYSPLGRAHPRFSSVSLDRSGAPDNHALVTAEWLDGVSGGRIVRWPLYEPTGLMGPTVTSSGVWRANGATNMQGALMKDGKFGISTTVRDWFSARVGDPLRREVWPRGGQDLHYAPTSNRIYSLTEFEGDRMVFAIPAGQRGL